MLIGMAKTRYIKQLRKPGDGTISYEPGGVNARRKPISSLTPTGLL
jgi:hypothetical protein